MSVDALLQDLSGAKTEVIDLTHVRREQELRERLYDPEVEKKRDTYLSKISERKSKAIVVHGLRRSDQTPIVRARRPTPDFYQALERDFIGPVDLYQYSQKRNKVICVPKYID